ncbi:hypothetical protein FC52_GL000461 [Lactobacillus pasteurii DSM 23907 = CRBIP 24.76]|uniref:Fluoride-specific ion channel FluC n=1 Tax=Lactobacillus pasteurii DSM 23907 = CRBIP 24.76 TaxID=1423790 RepID=I7LBS7_9LACO|nr:fluoride efflux transporter CrcB [Lactobacillus pasteurii]KRK08760.1 hypothetical protein FC52_GL000461 [Lactobacillus pasteurii DSM 23907 = CRBIP 24.76]TDG76405.1 hypothetical protein C5L33_001164 [Lactobacillus pasteurii]CCI85871.1 Protein CrcB homolog 2 [Lactobacillus pasteurii DSM 23907 = CRBIP 24.76]
MEILLTGFGASLGAISRYFLTNYGKKHWQNKFALPIATLIINLTGAFLLGLFYALKLNTFAYLFLGTGMMGGYTTFSTLNTELYALVKNKQNLTLIWYLALTYVAGFILLYLGVCLGNILG